MSEPIIEVRGISKHYRLGSIGATTLRESFERQWDRLRGRSASATGTASGDFWALQDISFDVATGEVLGIIGHNGAGKSTLLKILSRITEPTRGEITLRGRVASLLEVGTGFHPDLSGRENVYLNGAILGMKKREIDRKFDEIVEFAGVEKFIDTPTKRYSSGMSVRLAFAVAAHLDPEILVVDEVLAVGDREFQRKCLGKMKSVAAEQGRTVLFVSHNLGSVSALCDRAIVLSGGRVVDDATPDEAIRRYLQPVDADAYSGLAERRDRKGSGLLRFEKIELRGSGGREISTARTGEPVILRFYFDAEADVDLRDVLFTVGIDGDMGERITTLSNQIAGDRFARVTAGSTHFEIAVDKWPLMPGRYSLNLYCADVSGILDWVERAGQIDVAAGTFFPSGRLPASRQAQFVIDHEFSVGCGDESPLAITN